MDKATGDNSAAIGDLLFERATGKDSFHGDSFILRGCLGEFMNDLQAETKKASDMRWPHSE
jgi:hypothetical protein